MFERAKDRSRQVWAEVFSQSALLQTVDTLVAEHQLTDQQAARARAVIQVEMEKADYVLHHLAAHIAIGVVFAFDVVPLPLGTISRVGWVLGARTTEALRGREAHAQVHSFKVLGISAIPLLGYAAYFYALKRQSPMVAALAASSFSIWKTGEIAEIASKQFPSPVKRVLKPLWSWSE